MKTVKYLISALSVGVISLSLHSCDMDMQLDDRIDHVKATYEQLARCNNHMRATFYPIAMLGPYNGFSAGGYMMAGYTDEAVEADRRSPVNDWYRGNVSSFEMPLWSNSISGGIDRWTGHFSSIFNCNEAIMYLQDPTLVTDFDDSLRPGMIAQYYILRAYNYLQLIKRYGGVPIVSENAKDDSDYTKAQRASFAQCVDYIIASCDKAIEMNPHLQWVGGGQEPTPWMNRSCVEAIKSEAALYAASPLWCDDYAGTQKYTWERAAQITKQALDLVVAHGAALFNQQTQFPIESDFGANAYGKYFLSPYPFARTWDQETIYQTYYYGHIQSMVWQYSGLPIDPAQISAGACPSQEMVDAYEVLSVDGSRSEPLLDLARPYNSDGTPNFNPEALALGYQDCTDKMYRNRDPRFYATVYYDNATIDYHGSDYQIQTYVGGNCGLELGATNKRHTCTGYYLRKFSNANSGTEQGNKCGYFRMYRLAELYLNFAEAAYHARRSADAKFEATTVVEGGQTNTYGEAMSSRDALNKIRERVGMPAVVDSKNYLLRLHNERRVELAFEEHRFFDVRRWTQPQSDLFPTDRKVGGMKITFEDGRKTYQRFVLDRQCYTNKYLMYPLNIEEVKKMAFLTGENWQNPGWN